MVNVGIADLNVVKYPDVLATYALGSCVGICLYDHKAKIAGMAHIMLPSSAESQTENDNMRRYADTGVAELIRKMCSYGAKKTVRPKSRPVCSATMGILLLWSACFTAATFRSPTLKTSESPLNICAPPAIFAVMRRFFAP